MAILSTLKSRRLRSHKSEKTQQIITFQIEREWFALPIFAVKRVVPKSDTHGDYHGSGAGLTVYEGKELIVLDITQQVFGSNRDRISLPAIPPVTSTPSPTIASTSSDSTSSQVQVSTPKEYLLILRDYQGDLIGLPIESPPTVRRVPQSAIVPLPASYAARVNIQCVSSLVVQADAQPILFLLNHEQLFRSQPLLPPSLGG